jgi:DNA replication protein DnaC
MKYLTKDKKGKDIYQDLKPPKIIEPKWCEGCGYALKTNDKGQCVQCVENNLNKGILAKNRTISEKNRLTYMLGGDRAYREYTMERFLDRQVGGESVKGLCGAYPDINIYIYGSTGSGKTHLGSALIRRMFPNFVKIKPMELLRKMRECETAVAEGTLIELYARINLMLDDLGVEKITEYAYQVIYEILDKRYERGEGGLIVTSNLKLDALADKFGSDRIPSRIAQMCGKRVIPLVGKDWRV